MQTFSDYAVDKSFITAPAPCTCKQTTRGQSVKVVNPSKFIYFLLNVSQKNTIFLNKIHKQEQHRPLNSLLLSKAAVKGAKLGVCGGPLLRLERLSFVRMELLWQRSPQNRYRNGHAVKCRGGLSFLGDVRPAVSCAEEWGGGDPLTLMLHQREFDICADVSQEGKKKTNSSQTHLWRGQASLVGHG